jgi:hypothetical protein
LIILKNQAQRRGSMTIQQLYLFNSIYLVATVVVAILTRATGRRIVGAVSGAGASGVVAILIIAIGERAGWWHIAITWKPYFLTVMLVDFALCAFIFLIT